MDYISVETDFEVQVMRNQALIDVANGVRKEILLLEEDENKRLSSSQATKGVLEQKISELRTDSIKYHEMQRELIDDAEQLRGLRVRQVEGQLGIQLEKCFGQERAATKAKYDGIKARLRIEQDHGSLMTKTLKDLTKSMSLIKVLNYQAGASSGDDMSLITYVEQRLKGKQKDFERLGKQRARVEKLKESLAASERGSRMSDDLSSIASSDADSAFESDSETSALSKMLQENIDLTLEKQKLEDEVKIAKEKKKQLTDNIACIQANVQALQDKVNDNRLVKEEQHSLEKTLQEVEDEITKSTADCVALEGEVERYNVQIQKVKDEIDLLQIQLQGRDFNAQEAREVQELEQSLIENKQQLELDMKKIEEKLKENSRIKQSNNEMNMQLEELKLSNVEVEKQLKEQSEKNEAELDSLKLKIKQLNKDNHTKTENIKNLIEKNGILDKEIEEGAEILVSMKESLEILRTQKLEIDADMDKIKAEIIQTESLAPTSVQEAELDKKISALEVKLQEKEKERDAMEGHLRQLKQENQLAKNLLKQVQDNSEKEQLMKQEVEKAGLFSWLPTWGSSSKQQDPSN